MCESETIESRQEVAGPALCFRAQGHRDNCDVLQSGKSLKAVMNIPG